MPESLLNNVTGLQPGTLSQNSLWSRYFSLNFPKFFRASFLQNTPGQLLLEEQVGIAIANNISKSN